MVHSAFVLLLGSLSCIVLLSICISAVRLAIIRELNLRYDLLLLLLRGVIRSLRLTCLARREIFRPLVISNLVALRYFFAYILADFNVAG